MTDWLYILSVYALMKRPPETAAGTTTAQYWRRLDSLRHGKRGLESKMIRVGLGYGFKLRDAVVTLDFLHSAKPPGALWKVTAAEVARGYPVAVSLRLYEPPSP